MANKNITVGKRFEILPGKAFETWKGHKLDGSRASLPQGVLSYLANGRIVAGVVHPRPGLSRANSAETASTITGSVSGMAAMEGNLTEVILVNSKS